MRVISIRRVTMPVIKVWCLPEIDEPKLNELHKSIVRAVVSVEELEAKSERDMTCLFPPDMMKYGLGSEIIVEVTGLFAKPERTDEVRQRLAERLGQAVKRLFPDTQLIECFVYPFSPAQGFWTSRTATAINLDEQVLPETDYTGSATFQKEVVDIAMHTLSQLPPGWHSITFSKEGHSALFKNRRWGTKLFHVAFESGDPVMSERGIVQKPVYASLTVDFNATVGELLYQHFHFEE
jgi:hypothetical protein